MPVARAQSLRRGACNGGAQSALPHGTGDRCACDWRACLRVPLGHAVDGMGPFFSGYEAYLHQRYTSVELQLDCSDMQIFCQNGRVKDGGKL